MEYSHIELRLLNYRLRILSVKKKSIHKLMFPLIKIAFTNKSKCTFFSFVETNDDFTIIVDNFGFDELNPFVDEVDVTVSQSNWIPVYLSGDDLPGSMSISKIAKYLILPLADWKISILALSMYQSDYILFQENDYDIVIKCLSNHIPKIYDESTSIENEINLNTFRCIKNGTRIEEVRERVKSDDHKQRQITLPLLIPDNSEYCITGLYNLDTFFLIIPTLIDIMFYGTEEYGENEIFFNFTRKETDISLVMETKLLKKFPDGSLLNIHNDSWRLIRIGKLPVGLEVFGVCASISQPLEYANIDEYYISSYHTGYCFIPADKLDVAKELFAKRKAKFYESMKNSPVQLDELLATAASDNNSGLLMINTHDDSKSDSNSSDTFRYELDKNYSIQLEDVKQTNSINSVALSATDNCDTLECEHKTSNSNETTFPQPEYVN